MFAGMVCSDLLSFVPFKDFLTLQIEKKKSEKWIFRKNGFKKMDFLKWILKWILKMGFFFLIKMTLRNLEKT
jgi:hypothetical protein